MLPRVGLVRWFIDIQIARLGERLTSTNDLIQDLVPVPSPSKEVLAEALVDVSRFLAIHFFLERLLRFLVEKGRTGNRWLMSRWDVEPQCGWVTSALGNFTIELRRCVPCLNTLRHDDLFSSPSKSFNIFRMIRILPFLSLFFDCLRTAAYNGPRTLFRKASLKRVTKAYLCFFLIFWVLCGQPLGN